MRRYILTGGPGTGKTSLLEALRSLGYHCSAEVSRQVIIEETVNGSSCLPWKDLPCFAARCLDRMITEYETVAAAGGEAVFFDRGIPDIIAYLHAGGQSVPSPYYSAVAKYLYHPIVWLLPPWEEIYVQDPQRWQRFEEAQQIDQQIRVAYRMAGYKILELPKTTVAERVQFIQQSLTIIKERSL